MLYSPNQGPWRGVAIDHTAPAQADRAARQGKAPEYRVRGPKDQASRSQNWRLVDGRTLLVTLVLISGYMVAELVAGIISGSLALVADMAHVMTDVVAISLAFVALRMSSRPASVDRTFGYHRTEVMVTLLNVIALVAIAVWIFVESAAHIREGRQVSGDLLLIVGPIGIVINGIAFTILHRSARLSFNVQDAFWNVLVDLLGAIGVTVTGVLIVVFGWTLVDAIVGMVLGALLLVAAWQLSGKVFSVLVEGTPADVDVYRLCSRMEEIEGVTLVHDIHVWTVSSRYRALTAHVLIDPEFGGDVDRLLVTLRGIAADEFNLRHVTIQVERSLEGCEEDHHVGHLEAHSKSDG